MKIKMPRKRAEEIFKEEFERFLKENKHIDRDELRKFLEEQKEKDND